MASLTDNASLEDILDDLNLHRAILESLNEERPDAVDERLEILDIIKDLETRLAELRGIPPDSPPARPVADHANVSRPQLDGPSDSGTSSPWSSKPHRPPNAPLVAPTRKRQRNGGGGDGNDDDVNEDDDEEAETDSTDDLELPVKRVRTNRPLEPSGSGAQSSPSLPTDGLDDFDDDADELRKILGLDCQDTLLRLQEEQRKAEQWLAERKEQERRDEEFARRLNEGFQEPHRPSSPTSSPARQSNAAAFPAPTSSAQGLRELWTSYRDPSNSLDLGAPSFPNLNGPGSQRLPVPVAQESDDSDLAEITEGDFQRLTRSPSNLSPYSWMPGRPERQNFQSVPARSGMGSSGPVYGPNVFQNTLARLNAGRELFEQAGRSLFGSGSGPFSTHHGPGIPLPERAGPGMEPYYDMLNDLYEYADDPKKVNDDIKQLLETIRPDSEISKESREGTPEALRFTLLEHQKLGLSWMKSLEEQDQKGGILADDMGLGKTIQAIALMVSRPSEDPERKPTLIIAPVALMQQWKREIHRVLRPGRHQLSVYVLHGDKRAVSFRDLRDYDVVLTTFGTLSSELKRREKYDEIHGSGANEPTESRELLKSMPCLGPTSKWYRVIIDEAQCIKNRNTKAAIACCRLNSTYRWCMSGTPMMNSVEELHSLLKFLRIRPYSNLERFNHDFTRPLKSASASSQDKAMRQLQVLLKAVLLRRTKDSEIDGKPILNLPRRVSEKVHAVFSDDEQELYSALEEKTQLQFNKYLEAGTVGRNYSNILVLLLRLRQACCHPHLIKDYSVKLNSNTDELDLVENAKAFGNEVVIRLKGNSDLECPICIDAVDNPIIFFPCGHSTCAECFSRISDPELSVRQGHDGTVDVKCPNCRGKVDPKKITDHMSFKKVHFPDESGDTAELEPLKPVEEEDEDDSDDSDQDSLSRFIVSDEDEEASRPSKRKGKGKGKGKMPQKPKKTLADLKKEASKNQKSKRKYLRRLEKTWISSAKIDKAMEILSNVQYGEAKEKTIIFSQFTALLDLLEVPIMRRGWGYRRYDGSMRPADRNSAVLDFTDDPDCRIMLVSLKAGNAGLNLVAASQVIIFDPFWNPYIEEQAIDRAHRIGQQREVQIHRILVENTVEDRILELQDKKREIIEGALDEKASKSISRLGTRELAYLFGVQ